VSVVFTLRLVMQGIEVLEGALNQNPFEIVTTEPFLFNICEFVLPSRLPPVSIPFFFRSFPLFWRS